MSSLQNYPRFWPLKQFPSALFLTSAVDIIYTPGLGKSFHFAHEEIVYQKLFHLVGARRLEQDEN